MVKFEGKWKYQSYRPDPGSVAADPKQPPTFVRWSPPGVVTIDEGGTTGTLEFTVPSGPPPKLTLQFQVTKGSPGRLSVSASMKLPGGKQFTNELQGWFVPAKLGEEVGEDLRRVAEEGPEGILGHFEEEGGLPGDDGGGPLQL